MTAESPDPAAPPDPPALPVRPNAGTDRHWFEDIARFLGPAYLRYSFTKGTAAEVDFLVEHLELGPGDRVLDAGCGPGRHALELARRGVEVVGLDISADFVRLAREAATAESLAATFEVEDLRGLDRPGSFDAVLCLCQGGFGLLGGVHDEDVFARLAASLAPGGRMALTAFSLAFMIRHLDEGETLNLSDGVLHETTVLKDSEGLERPAELWTTGFTTRELRLLAEGAGLAVDGVYGVTPGRYGTDPPTLDDPELLLLAHRPEVAPASPSLSASPGTTAHH